MIGRSLEKICNQLKLATFQGIWHDIHEKKSIMNGRKIHRVLLLREPPHKKTNNLHMQKQRRRSAVQ